MASALKSLGICLLFVFFIGLVCAQNVTNTSAPLSGLTYGLLTFNQQIQAIGPIVTMITVFCSAICFGLAGTDAGGQMQKQFGIMAQGLLGIAALSAIVVVVGPPVIGAIYGQPNADKVLNPNTHVWECPAGFAPCPTSAQCSLGGTTFC